MKNRSLVFLIAFFLSPLCYGEAIFFDPNEITAVEIDPSDTVKRRDQNPYEVKPNLKYVASYWHDTKAVVVSPFHWKGKDFLKAGITIGITAALYSVDQQIKDWSQEKRNSTSNKIGAVFEPLGNGRYLMITSGAVFLTGVLIKSKRAQKAGLLILESQIINGVLGQVMKVTASRHRPRDGARYNHWDGPNLQPYSSFPSGHAQTVFAFSTAIATVYGDHKWVPPICYGVATLTSLSRINDNAHWTSDVFLGSVLGYFITKTVVNRHVNKENPALSVMPIMGGNYSGLKLSYVLD